LIEDELLEFRLWKTETNEEYYLDVSFDQSMPNPEVRFANNGLSSISGLKIYSTGFNQFNANAIRIFPNPTRDKVYIQLSNSAPSTISVFDITGQRLLFNNYLGNKIEIDLSTFESGIYLIEVKGENILKVDRLIKK